MKLTKKQRSELHSKYGGKCAYCGCELPAKWHADHIEPVIRDIEIVKKGQYWTTKSMNTHNNPHLETIKNLNPSCPECNIHKSSGSLEHFRRMLSEKLAHLERYSKDYRFALKFGLLTPTPKPIVFYFELIGVSHV